jgi:hypothetical protein
VRRRTRRQKSVKCRDATRRKCRRFAHLVEVVQVAHLARRDGGEGDERDGGAKERSGHPSPIFIGLAR